MTWLAAIALALAAFAIAAFAFGLARNLWTSLLAALALGLAGYAMQASPDLQSAPKAAAGDQEGAPFDIVAGRGELLAANERSQAEFMLLADAMAREGNYVLASQTLSGITQGNPEDFEAWLAQGIALSEHAGGALTPASLYAYRRASALRPDHLAPGYFLGVSLIRQGRMMEARQVWTDTLASSAEDATGRAALTERLARLEAMLGVPQEDISASETGQR